SAPSEHLGRALVGVDAHRIDGVSAAARQTGDVLIGIETKDAALAARTPVALSFDIAAIGRNVDRLNGIDPISGLHANLRDPGSRRNVTIQEGGSASAAGEARCLTDVRRVDGSENQSDRV